MNSTPCYFMRSTLSFLDDESLTRTIAKECASNDNCDSLHVVKKSRLHGTLCTWYVERSSPPQREAFF